MSWNPLRKLSLNQRPDLDSSTQTANENLEKLVLEFDSAENVTKSLYQAAKKLPDHILCTGKFETKLTDELSSSNLFSKDDYMSSVIEEWHSFAFVSDTIGDEYVVTLQKSVLQPLKQLKQAFAELRSAIRLHDSIQFDVIKFQRKVASYSEREKTGANLVKLQESKQALAASQREFSKRTQLLINDLSKFIAGSVEMLRPLLEGFIAAEVAWIRACKSCIDKSTHLSTTARMDTQPDRLRAIEDSFKAMGALSICSDSK